MSVKLQRVIQVTKELSANERAQLAHCLIYSLENNHDEDVDAAWATLAEQRLDQLESGEVSAVSWEQIKDRLKRSSQ